MTAPPLVPSPLYGLRTWTVAAERLVAPQRGIPWPEGGGWLTALCEAGAHAAPARGCACGIHAWHPSRRAARRVLGTRGTIAGVIEAIGAIELHRDGFRAERARPRALLAGPRANRPLIDRLAAAYACEVVPVARPADLVAWCRAQGYGLEPDIVDGLLGAETVAATRRRTRIVWLRFAAALAAIAAAVAIGAAVTETPHGETLNGRTGPVYVP